jgi:predicted amidohydrolase
VAGANLAEHRRVLVEASGAGCSVAVFPEMSLSGSVDPAQHGDHLLALDDPMVTALVASTGEIGVAAVFGIAEAAEAGPYITQVFAEKGRLVGVQRKRLLGEGEEAYAVADADELFEVDGVPFAIAICAESRIDRPFAHARSRGADLVCFSAAPGLYERRTTEAEWRSGWNWWCAEGLGDAQRQARTYGLWIAIATQAGSTVDEDFPGLAALVDPSGDVVAQLPDRRPGILVVDVPL